MFLWVVSWDREEGKEALYSIPREQYQALLEPMYAIIQLWCCGEGGYSVHNHKKNQSPYTQRTSCEIVGKENT